MIEQAGIRFDKLEPESLDMPLGFKTGAGVYLWSVWRCYRGGFFALQLNKQAASNWIRLSFKIVRGEAGMREAVINVGDAEL